MASVRIPDLIAKKRDGNVLTKDEISQWVTQVVDGSCPMEQIGAMLMAIYLKDMTPEETVHLTEALMFSGEILKWVSLSHASVPSRVRSRAHVALF